MDYRELMNFHTNKYSKPVAAKPAAAPVQPVQAQQTQYIAEQAPAPVQVQPVVAQTTQPVAAPQPRVNPLSAMMSGFITEALEYRQVAGVPADVGEVYNNAKLVG